MCNSSLREQEIMRLYRQLGNPSFQYLKLLFPSLFQTHDSFQCEICQLAKHKRISFPTISYRASKPFMLIHGNFWSHK